jgi:hypothetical protein
VPGLGYGGLGKSIHAYLNLCWLKLCRPELWDVGVNHAQVADMANRTCCPSVVIPRLPQTDVGDEGSVCQPGVHVGSIITKGVESSPQLAAKPGDREHQLLPEVQPQGGVCDVLLVAHGLDCIQGPLTSCCQLLQCLLDYQTV